MELICALFQICCEKLNPTQDDWRESSRGNKILLACTIFHFAFFWQWSSYARYFLRPRCCKCEDWKPICWIKLHARVDLSALASALSDHFSSCTTHAQSWYTGSKSTFTPFYTHLHVSIVGSWISDCLMLKSWVGGCFQAACVVYLCPVT